MLEDASNQELLSSWQCGDQHAAQILVRRFMVRLTALARSRLSQKLARRLDPEDIVLSAWRSFFVAAGNHRVAVPADDNLWPLLVTMTLRKLHRQATRQSALQRDVDAEVRFDLKEGWQNVVSREPSPEEAALVVDEVESLMSMLAHTDRDVLARLLQGEGPTEIATALGCSERTIRRSVQKIRERFEQLHQEDTRQVPKSAVTGSGSWPATSTPPAAAMPTPVPDAEPTIDYSDVLLKRLIGQGGFGKVYLAHLRSDGATVAVKFLRKQFWKDARSVQSMFDEMSRVAVLSHPNIIRHNGWGRTQRGAVFIAMEWIDGSDTAAWRQHSRPPVDEIIDCGLAVIDALAAAHAAHIIHGDVTPGNILRRGNGTFVLSDFGFAQSLAGSPRPRIGGTPGFLAPEQVSDAFGPISEQTDVYGVGGLLYSLLTGHPPMSGRDVPEILASVLSSKPPLPASRLVNNVPDRVDQLILQCLSKEPSQRPSSMFELKESLLETREAPTVRGR
ncbi:MAG: protein kinase [Planctomycetaceae bacterium]|nr:protein kinase [Planctomycetaceae bacterium]